MLPERYLELSDSGYLAEFKKLFHCVNSHSDYVDFASGEVEMDFETANNIWSFLQYSKDFDDCLKIIHADNVRYNRLLNRIKRFLDLGDCVFFTLTFTDDVLNNTNEDTRRKYVRRFLKQHSSLYIANIDFGPKTNREHYHGVIVIDYDKINSFVASWAHGFANARLIIDNKQSSERVSRYMLKIANHFVKKSVKRNYVIYSRESVKFAPDLSNFFSLGVADSFGNLTDVHVFRIERFYLPDVQLSFWNHLPHLNDSNFDLDDYDGSEI